MTESVSVEPMDEHNQALLDRVHPPDWVNPTPAKRYNLVVIGAGTAGLVTAAGCAGLGGKVALIERYLLGGDCLITGCVPSKALIRSGHAAAAIAGAAKFGVRAAGEVTVDFDAVMRRMRELRSRIAAHDSAERFRDLGVDVFLGDGRFSETKPDTVEVVTADGDVIPLRYAKAVIATGARAVEPEISGLADAGYHTNETIFNLTELPKRLGVFGAGPIGCELAQTFARLGSDVTLLEMGEHILRREDPEASEIVERAFVADGVNLRLKTKAVRIETRDGAKCVHAVTADGADAMFPCDEILIGAGRQPNVEGLNLEAVGVDYDARKGVAVDDRLRTTNKRIFAAGDICQRLKFTHTADAAARIVLRNALFWGRDRFSALTIPWCTYVDPAVARVGLNDAEAEAAGIEVDTYKVSFDEVDRAVADGEQDGFVKVLTRKGTDQIVGATIVARTAGDMISEITLAMVAKKRRGLLSFKTRQAGLGVLGSVIHPYPTQAEAIRAVANAYNRTRLSPGVAKLFNWLLARRR